MCLPVRERWLRKWGRADTSSEGFRVHPPQRARGAPSARSWAPQGHLPSWASPPTPSSHQNSRLAATKPSRLRSGLFQLRSSSARQPSHSTGSPRSQVTAAATPPAASSTCRPPPAATAPSSCASSPCSSGGARGGGGDCSAGSPTAGAGHPSAACSGGAGLAIFSGACKRGRARARRAWVSAPRGRRVPARGAHRGALAAGCLVTSAPAAAAAAAGAPPGGSGCGQVRAGAGRWAPRGWAVSREARAPSIAWPGTRPNQPHVFTFWGRGPRSPIRQPRRALRDAPPAGSGFQPRARAGAACPTTAEVFRPLGVT